MRPNVCADMELEFDKKREKIIAYMLERGYAGSFAPLSDIDFGLPCSGVCVKNLFLKAQFLLSLGPVKDPLL